MLVVLSKTFLLQAAWLLGAPRSGAKLAHAGDIDSRFISTNEITQISTKRTLVVEERYYAPYERDSDSCECRPKHYGPRL